MMAEDLVPNLLQTINQQFDLQAKASKKLQIAAKSLKHSKATYRTANDFAVECGNLLAAVLKRNLTPDNLPDQKLYYNIANRILNETLKKNFDLVSGYSGDVQRLLNAQAEIGIKVQKPVLNQDRIDGLVNAVSDETNFDRIKSFLDDPIVNFCQSIVDDSIDVNCRFQFKAGLHPLITRRLMGKACDWCKNLAGTYDYADLPEDIYRRHLRCRCTVEYNPGSGKRQDVWSKKWRDSSQDAKIKGRNVTKQLPKGREFVKSRHGRIRQSERKITDSDIKAAMDNPIHVDPDQIDELGRKSRRFIGKQHVVVYNPDTKKVITTFPTNRRFRNRYGKGGDE